MATKRRNEDVLEEHHDQKKINKEAREKESQLSHDRTKAVEQEPQASCSQGAQRANSSQVTDTAVISRVVRLASTDHQKALMDRCQAVIDSLREQLFGIGLQERDQKTAVQAWKTELMEVKEKLKFPKTTIAVVGDTGAGKSSLINALLDHGGLLPTSAVRACTAAVVEVSKNTKSTFEANIEFLSKKEWDDELEILIEDLTDSNGAMTEDQPASSSDVYVPYCKVMAVYGRVGSKDELSRQTEVTRCLGKIRKIKSNKSEKFGRLVTKYIETREPREGGQFWPIVKRVQLKLPDCDVCSSGATLVDLPGSSDSNAARNKIANEYQKTCKELWIVSSVERATDKKTATDILGERFHRQRLMDGNYGSTAFICTKTDTLKVQEVVRSLKLEDKIKDKKDKKKQMEERKKKLERKDRDLKADIKKLKDELARTKDKAAEENLSKQICEAKLSRMEVLEQKEDLGDKIREHEKAILAICAKARNDYCTSHIKMDFRDRLVGFKRRAGMLNQDDDDDEDDDVKSSAENLKVFCVSSTEYQKMRKLLTDDGPPEVFSTEDDTQIPALKNYVHEIMSQRKREFFEELVKNLDRFVSELNMYIADSLVEPSNRASATERIERELEKLTEAKKMVIERLSEGIRGVFGTNFKQKIEEGTSNAASGANATCAKWGEDFQCSTYKATVKRRGVFFSPAYGHVNFNEDLAEPFYRSISIIWEKAFSTFLLDVMDSFKNDVLSKLQNMKKEIASQLMDLVKSKGHSKTVIELVHKHASDKFTETLSRQKDEVRRKQQDLSRLVTRHIQAELGDVYMQCKEQTGNGTFARMKECMAEEIDEKQNTMFDAAKQTLLTELAVLQKEMLMDAGNIYEDIITYLKREYQLLLKPTSAVIKSAFEKPIAEAYKSMQEICAEAGLNKNLDVEVKTEAP